MFACVIVGIQQPWSGFYRRATGSATEFASIGIVAVKEAAEIITPEL
jgi:hypothetical protein